MIIQGRQREQWRALNPASQTQESRERQQLQQLKENECKHISRVLA